MSNTESMASASPGPGLEGVHPQRLFRASCVSLISTAVAFGVVTSFLGQLKTHFGLDNTQVGWIGGAALWGFTVSIFILGPLCDALGMRVLMRLALVGHFAGVLLMIFANGFTMLFLGALVIALGNGTVEAACNPLVATIFPNNKTEKLARFHVWFPGGIVIGGVIAYLIDTAMPSPTATALGMLAWQIKLAVVLIPTVIYGILFTGQKFPLTERVQSGISFGGMVKATFCRPLFIVLFFCMMITASLELGPGRWMGEAMKSAMKFAGENAGILVLVYGSTLMAVLRFKAGPVVHKLSNTGLLVVSAILSGLGLFWLTYVSSPAMVIVATTVFYVGVCYFWPTMLGTAAERVPKGGALALSILGGTGMAVVGLITSPLMGWIADGYVRAKVPVEDAKKVLAQVGVGFPELRASASETAKKDIDAAIEAARAAIPSAVGAAASPQPVVDALRAAIKAAPDSQVGKDAQKIIESADQHGSLMSFRWVSGGSLVIIVVFGILYLQDRRKGGYKAESIVAKGLAEGIADGVPPDRLNK